MEQQTVMELTKSMRTRCIGRHLADLPETFQQNYRASSVTLYFGHDADFETVEAQVIDEGVAPEKFLGAVKQRSAEIAAETNEKSKQSMLLLNEEVGENATLFRYQKSDISDRSQTHELHLLVSGVQVFLKADSYDGEVALVEARLKTLAKQVRVVSDPQHAGAGFCLGPVVIDAVNDYELADFRFRDGRRAHRDVSLQIELNTFKQDENGPRLIQRVDSSLSVFGFGPKVFRKGQMQLAGMSAEEWLGRHGGEGWVEHGFSVESYPTSPAQTSPVLQLQLKTGGMIPNLPTSGLPPYLPSTPVPGTMSTKEVNSSLSDDEAIGLWDAIVKSVRPRPDAVKP